MSGRNFLFIPGPTNIPERVRRAMDVPLEDHRRVDYPQSVLPLFNDLKKVFKTSSGQVLIFASSGTGGWEAALTNTLSQGDKVLQARIGQFSHLWAEACKRLGFDMEIVDCEWGSGIPLEQYRAILAADTQHKIKAVLATHNETATGVTSDIHGVRKILDELRHPALLYVDGISSIGCLDFRMDEWGVDLAIAGSQKGFMLPTGLSIIGVSQKAIEATKTATMRRAYFDFADMLRMNADGWFPYTPAMTLIHGLRESVNMLLEEGLDNVYARHQRFGEATRRAVAAWGLKLCAKEPKHYSNTVSTICVPEGVDSGRVVSHAYQRYNLSLGGGLAQLAGKVFRIGHLGDLNELMIVSALAGTEMVLRDCGVMVTPGSGVAAAQEYLRATFK